MAPGRRAWQDEARDARAGGYSLVCDEPIASRTVWAGGRARAGARCPIELAGRITLAGGRVTTTTVELTWNAPGDDGTVGRATSYDLRYSTATIDAGTWAAATPVTGEPSPALAGMDYKTPAIGV